MIINISSVPGKVPTYSDAVVIVPSCHLACVPTTGVGWCDLSHLTWQQDGDTLA